MVKIGDLFGSRPKEVRRVTADVKPAGETPARGTSALRVAEVYLNRGQWMEAAKMFAQAEAWEKAAELFEKGGYALRAAECYERGGQLPHAAECYERHYVENVTPGTQKTAAADLRAALQAGQLYARVGDHNRALHILARAGFHREAGAAAEALAKHEVAAEHFARAGELERAADAWERAGTPVKAALLRGEAAFKEDRVREAAAFFQQGEDYYRAGELFESLQLRSEAAAAYEAGGLHAEAAAVHVRAGDKQRAAAAFEAAGQLETAAGLYERAGEALHAARLYQEAGSVVKSAEVYARAGDRELAIAMLQRVDHSDERYPAATELLARLFVEVGLPALAVERLRRLLSGRPIDASNIGLYYWLAVCAELDKDAPVAAGLYKQILAIDYGFRDVSHRLQGLAGGGWSAEAAAPSPAAAPEFEEVEEVLPPAAVPEPVVEPESAAPRLVTRELVGEGPLGAIYRAEDRTDGRSMALRVLPEHALGARGLGPVVSDLVAAAALSHPNLVKVLGVVDLNGQSCVLSEFVPGGGNLAQQLAGGQRMSLQQCHSLGRTLALVLAFVHSRGLVHASVRPSNVMLVAGVVKLADLGLGRLHLAARPGDGYRAPEARFDVAGDIYAIGAVLYRALTGVDPKARAAGPLNRAGLLAPGVPQRFDGFLMRCLDPEPARRFPTAMDVSRSLDSMITIR